jgi:hypothetical protein
MITCVAQGAANRLPLYLSVWKCGIQIDVKTRFAIRKIVARQELDVESYSHCLAVLVGSCDVKGINFSDVRCWNKRCLGQRHIKIVVFLL